MKNSEVDYYNLSNRLKVLGFIGICLVVLIHIRQIPRGWMSGEGTLTIGQFLLNFGVINLLGRLAVPMFFVISGYWLAIKCDFSFEWWKKVVCKRSKSLLLPMIEWAALAILYEWLIGGGGGKSSWLV